MSRPVLLSSPPPCTHTTSDLSCPQAKRCERCSDLVCDCGVEADPALQHRCPAEGCHAPAGEGCRRWTRRGWTPIGAGNYHPERRMVAAGICLTCEGREWVIVYDSYGIADQDRCPSCRGSGRAS